MKNTIKFIKRKYIGDNDCNIFKKYIKNIMNIVFFIRSIYIYILSFLIFPFILIHKKYEEEIDFIRYLISLEISEMNQKIFKY